MGIFAGTCSEEIEKNRGGHNGLINRICHDYEYGARYFKFKYCFCGSYSIKTFNLKVSAS